jgi:hypothetical protein
MKLGQGIRLTGHLNLPTQKGSFANFPEHFQKKRFLVPEVTVKDRLGDASCLGDFLRGSGVIAQRREKLLGVGEQFPFTVGLGQASGGLSRLSPAAADDGLGHGRRTSCRHLMN